MTDRTFPFADLSIDEAPEAARGALRATESHLGFLPVAMRRQAVAPLVGSAFGARGDPGCGDLRALDVRQPHGARARRRGALGLRAVSA